MNICLVLFGCRVDSESQASWYTTYIFDGTQCVALRWTNTCAIDIDSLASGRTHHTRMTHARAHSGAESLDGRDMRDGEMRRLYLFGMYNSIA